MGLRLYQAPVESDVQSKRATDKTVAQARSSIRRTWRPNRDQARERRRRMLVAAGALYPGGPDPAYPHALDAEQEPVPEPETSTLRTATNDAPSLGSASAPGRRALRDMANRMNIMGALDDRVVAMFGSRWAELHARSNSPPRDDGGFTVAADSSSTQMPSVPPAPPREPYVVSSLRSTQAQGRERDLSSLQREASPGVPSSFYVYSQPVRITGTNSASPRSPSPPARYIPDRRREARDMQEASRARLLRAARGFGQWNGLASPGATSALSRSESSRLERDEVRLDGLGDRNQSLSPEGEHVWDTLLSTLTPDPQPPSVVSSFASTSASAVASQTGPAGSSSTSLTGQEVADMSSLDPPCESGCEGTDTEGDEDDEEQQTLTLTRFRSRLGRGNPSYAEVVRSNSEDFTETLDGMQRIVRNLARREDIPDEWWAEAGLSRTLSREDSTLA